MLISRWTLGIKMWNDRRQQDSYLWWVTLGKPMADHTFSEKHIGKQQTRDKSINYSYFFGNFSPHAFTQELYF